MRALHARSAFATVMMIILLGLVTVSLASLAMVTRSQSLRNRSAIEQAQARQLNLAALIDANQRASHWNDSPGNSRWTFELTNIGLATLQMTTPANGRVQLSISAGAQVLQATYTNTDAHWRLVEIENGH